MKLPKISRTFPVGNSSVMVVVVALVLILAGGAYWYMSQSATPLSTSDTSDINATVPAGDNVPQVGADDVPVTTPTTTPTTDTVTPDPAPTAPASETKTFTVTGRGFSFSPKEMRVKKGDKVKIIFTNAEGFHDFVIDEFNVRTAKISSGKSETIEFTANKAGTFEYYCSVGNHRAMGMKGSLIVE